MLIAEALAAGDISYEESLRARAYALFDDPRLEPAFRSPIANWEAMGALLDEISEKEPTLSRELVDDLLPFRVRPNHPRSIFNRPREEVLRTQSAPAPLPWLGRPVVGTNLRVWIQGSEQELEKYLRMAGRIWRAFPPYFAQPPDDVPGLDVPIEAFNSRLVNPDSRVDIYLIDGGVADPRMGSNCVDCAIGASTGRWNGSAAGEAREAANVSSGYVLVKKTRSDEAVIDTMAHELAHVSQLADGRDDAWLMESIATWVGYKVMIALGNSRIYEYRLLDPSLPPEPGQTERFPAPPLFEHLHWSLLETGNAYAPFLFFAYASQALGDDIVKRVWERASVQGVRGIGAVNAVIPLADHFPRFAVRNWNQDYLPVKYRDDDDTFPSTLKPGPGSLREMPSELGLFELGEPVRALSARYYRFTWPDTKVRKVTVQNLYHNLPNAHVWAIKKIGTDWSDPEDWSRDPVRELCRDSPRENVTELVLIVSDSHPEDRIPAAHPKPRVLVEDVGCEFIEGTAQSTLRLRDDRQDVTYVSSTARLRFKPRTVQDQPGNVQYDLMPTSVTWTVSGTQDDCTISGQTIATIPAFLDQPLDPTRPAYGYLNVVGVGGGDFHSLKVSAINPAATYTKTCPGDPPVVTQEPFRAGWLLQVLTQMNTHTGSAVTFSGTQTFDPDRFQDNLPQVARDFLAGNAPLVPTPQRGGSAPAAPPLSNLPPGIDPAEIEAAMARARQALQEADLQAGRVVYTFKWDLKPMTGAPPVP
jgi:hypothetical protein